MMSYSKVVAILDVFDFELINNRLQQYNIPGLSVSKVHGFGDYINEYDPNGLTESIKIEIYTSSEQAEALARMLAELASEVTDGGGVVAIEPVSKLMNVGNLTDE